MAKRSSAFLTEGLVRAVGQTDDDDHRTVLDGSSDAGDRGDVAERVGDGLSGGLGAQGGFEGLAHGGDGERVQHGDGLGRRRLLGHVVGGPATQLLGGSRWLRGERDERHRHLAGVQVRTTHRLRGRDRRVCQQHALDDRRVDVVTAADDQVLGSADEVDEAVRVDPGQVPGVQPAVAQLAQPVQHGPVGTPAGDVAGEHRRPADGEHARPDRPAGRPTHRRR